MQPDEFLKPTLHGKRFDGALIPLEFMRDLAVLNDMIREAAKDDFRKSHRDRQRVPRGFRDEVTLALSGIDDGGAKPIIQAFASMIGLLPNPHLEHYEHGRDAVIAAINAVAEGRSPTEFLSLHTLKLFSNFGNHLKDTESISFPTDNPERPVIFTREIRRKILLSLPEVEEVQEEVDLRGLIVELNQEEKTFILKRPDEIEVQGKIDREHYENIIEALTGYLRGVKLAIQGVGVRDRSDKLVRIEKIDWSNVLEPLDIQARIDELRTFSEGWLDGEGVALDPVGLDWLESTTLHYYDASTMPLPRIYPMPDGLLSFEWSFPEHMASLEVDLANNQGDWLAVNKATKADSAETIDLSGSEGWSQLGQLLNEIRGEQPSDERDSPSAPDQPEVFAERRANETGI